MVDAVLLQKHIAEDERIKRETLAQELRMGQQAQRTLLPQNMPHYAGVELAEKYIPAIEVGGDFSTMYLSKMRRNILNLSFLWQMPQEKGSMRVFSH